MYINNVRTYQGSEDCLNTIRLIAALQVLFGHSTRWLDIPYSSTIGHLSAIFQGVPIFFMLSGFLIWFSIGRSTSFKIYALKRFWRIYPELWVAVLFEIFVIILLYDGSIDWGRLLLFGLSECSFCVYVPVFLKNYGIGTPNGVLWTIFCLMKFYIIAYLAYKYMRGRPIIQWIIILGLLIVLGYISNYLYLWDIPYIRFIWFQTTLPFLWLFMIGAFIADKWLIFRSFFIKFWPGALLLSIIVEVTGIDINCSDPDFGYYFIRSLATIVWILGFAYSFPLLNLKTDISYPVYLYHMTIVQVIYIMGYRNHFILLYIIVVVVLFLSYLSTRYVGTWSKRKKLLCVK